MVVGTINIKQAPILKRVYEQARVLREVGAGIMVPPLSRTAKTLMLSSRTVPVVGAETPAMILPSVDLPEPDGPMMPRHSPGARWNDTPFSMA